MELKGLSDEQYVEKQIQTKKADERIVEEKVTREQEEQRAREEQSAYILELSNGEPQSSVDQYDSSGQLT